LTVLLKQIIKCNVFFFFFFFFKFFIYLHKAGWRRLRGHPVLKEFHFSFFFFPFTNTHLIYRLTRSISFQIFDSITDISLLLSLFLSLSLSLRRRWRRLRQQLKAARHRKGGSNSRKEGSASQESYAWSFSGTSLLNSSLPKNLPNLPLSSPISSRKHSLWYSQSLSLSLSPSLSLTHTPTFTSANSAYIAWSHFDFSIIIISLNSLVF